MDKDYGRRLIPNIIDDFAKSDPDRVYCFYAKSNHVADGFASVTYSQIANAINRVSLWLRDKIGTSKSLETIAYLGPPDLRYVIVTLAAQKNEFKAFLPSPRNSSEATSHILQASSCRHFVTAGPTSPLIKTILNSMPIQHLEMLSMSECLDPAPTLNFPYCKTFDQARSEPFVVLHTSGSTGLPKLVTPTHGTLAACDALQLASFHGYQTINLELLRGKTVFLGLPPFHAAGLHMLLNMPIFYDMIPVLGPLIPLTAEIVDQVHRQGIVHGSYVAPSVVEELVKVPPFLERLAAIDCLVISGGPLAKDAGDRAIEKTAVVNIMGTTETFLLPTQQVDREDWQYFYFSHCLGAELRHRWEDLFELVIARNTEFELSQGVFQTFPHLQEYSTKDLYSPHPTKPDLWQYRGRSDDVIVFSNGEKINPITMEGIIAMHPSVTGALVFGSGRFQSSLLIEVKNPAASDQQRRALIDSMWPTVKRANEDCPAHGRIAKDLILFTDPSKPMLRAGKGTIQRKSTENLYKDELEMLYSASGARNLQDFTTSNKALNAECIFHEILSQELNVEDIKLDDDLFNLGLDSLKIANITRQLTKSSLNCFCRLTPRDIYTSPTISQLAGLVQVRAEAEKLNYGNLAIIRDHTAEMKSLAADYTRDLPINSRVPKRQGVSTLKTVILTGSTGSLGSYLLHSLLEDQSVAQIFCLNRASQKPIIDRQRNIMKRDGLISDLSYSNIAFLETDLSQPYLGLPRATYMTLLQSVTHILHNAWDVNFNKSLKAFEPHIAGMRRLIDFCSQTTYGASIFFISSISAAMNWPAIKEGQMPESISDDWSLPQSSGYAEAKFVAERLLDEASMVSGVKSTVCRVGQVSGPTGPYGSWNVKEWFPSMLASSAIIGFVPETLGSMSTVDWIPVDLLAKIITELYFGDGDVKLIDKLERSCLNGALDERLDGVPYDSPNGIMHGLVNGVLHGSDAINSVSAYSELRSTCEVFHTVNPNTTTYQTLLPAILAMLPPTTRTVPLAEWVKSLEQSDGDLERNPALKLLDFYRGMVRMEKEGQGMVSLATIKTQERSKLLRNMQAVSSEWMTRWMRQWGLQQGGEHSS